MKKIAYKNYMKFDILSKVSNVEVVCSAVGTFATQLSFTEDEIYEIKTSVREAICNCILHAYNNNEGIITITTGIVGDNILEIIIKDKGIGIENIKQAREPLYTTAKEKGCSGLGFTVMECFMTNVRVYSTSCKGTTVRMKKKIV